MRAIIAPKSDRDARKSYGDSREFFKTFYNTDLLTVNASANKPCRQAGMWQVALLPRLVSHAYQHGMKTEKPRFGYRRLQVLLRRLGAGRDRGRAGTTEDDPL